MQTCLFPNIHFTNDETSLFLCKKEKLRLTERNRKDRSKKYAILILLLNLCIPLKWKKKKVNRLKYKKWHGENLNKRIFKNIKYISKLKTIRIFRILPIYDL